MITVNLKDFILKGEWNSIKVGMSRHDFYNLISLYSNSFLKDYSNIEEYMEEKIWAYGNVEFYFDSFIDSNNSLDMIFCDIFQVGKMIDGGDIFKIDKWFLETYKNPEKIELESVKNFMQQNNISFNIKYENSQYYSRINMLFNSGVKFSFDKEANLFYLRIICLQNTY